jgi:integrase
VARHRKPTPSYLLHKQSGRARLVWSDPLGVRHERLLPGAFNSTESLTAKARLELELATSPTGTVGDSEDVSIAVMLAAYLDHAERYYVDSDGVPTKELTCMKAAIRPLRVLYGDMPARLFGPQKLKQVREMMIQAGLCRSFVNHSINRVRRVFRWAAGEELVPVATYEGLRTLSGLRRGRTSARESKPVVPVDDATVDATLPYLSPHVRAMIEIMARTGMRPGEVCGLTLNQIERGSSMWVYRPHRHKTAHRGKGRSIPLGPATRDVLSAFLAGRAIDPDSPIFSPSRAREERFEAMRVRRKSKVQPSQVCRRKEEPARAPACRYTPGAIAHAVAIACDQAFPAPDPLSKRKDETFREWGRRLTDEQRKQLREWRRAHRWFPYQLRHAFATRVRRQHGLEAAQVLLGHTKADTTQIYAERNEALAVAVAAKIG